MQEEGKGKGRGREGHEGQVRGRRRRQEEGRRVRGEITVSFRVYVQEWCGRERKEGKMGKRGKSRERGSAMFPLTPGHLRYLSAVCFIVVDIFDTLFLVVVVVVVVVVMVVVIVEETLGILRDLLRISGARFPRGVSIALASPWRPPY